MALRDIKQLPILLAASFCSILLATACGAPFDGGTGLRNVFGPDNREKITSNETPYSAVGQVEPGCTGTLIGRRLVLTAAHCVYDAKTQAIKPNVVSFRAQVRNGKPAATSYIDYFWIGGDQPETNRPTDWAILRLRDPLGDRFGKLGLHEIDFAASLPVTINQMGYSVDRDQGGNLALHRGCYVHEVSENRLLNDCDSTSGISGGPIYIELSGIPHIVGIAVSEFRQGATESVRLDSYKRDHANVAISASNFLQTARTLLQTADVGNAAPQIEGVLERSNPNQTGQTPTTPTTPTPPATQEPATTPNGQAPATAGSTIVASEMLAQKAGQIYYEMGQLRLASQSIVTDIADLYQDVELREMTYELIDRTDDFGLFVAGLGRGHAPSDPRLRAYHLYQKLEQQIRYIDAYAQRMSSYTIGASLKIRVTALDAQLARVQTLIFMP